jgi:diguanylate cyclase (GGDEF)-like protein
MTAEVLLHAGLRGGTAVLALAALVVGVLRARAVRGDALRWTLRLLGALVLLGVAWLTLRDTLRVLARGVPPAMTLEAWLWLPLDALLPAFILLLIEGWRRRDALEARLAALSETDALTGLPNRRGFQASALAALAEARRSGRACAVVALDIDRFKAINDGHGHPAGDEVLRGVGAAIRAGLRGGDIAGRLGGEEFALLLPGDALDDAVGVAERLRALVRATVPHPAGDGVAVTLSAGAAAIAGGAPPEALADALGAADLALYAAKRQGRDRVAVAG